MENDNASQNRITSTGNSANSENDTSLNKAKYVLKETVSWLIILVVAIVLALFITNYVIFKAVVPSGSMENTIQVDDKLIGIRIIKKVSRGDILIFENQDLAAGAETEYLVKRVIGMPGETLEIKNGSVYIDGEVLLEDSLKDDYIEGNFGPYEIPEGSYFMMGDNRNGSYDARYWKNKFLAFDDITAKVLFRYNPNLHWFKAPNYGETEED